MAMPMFMFEVVQTADGFPDPLAYPEGLSYTPRYSGSAMIVYWEFPNEQIAKGCVVCDEENVYENPVWDKYKQLGAGLDIFFIKQLSLEESQAVNEAKARVLYSMYKDDGLTPEIFEKITGLTWFTEPLREPTEREVGLFYKIINEDYCVELA